MSSISTSASTYKTSNKKRKNEFQVYTEEKAQRLFRTYTAMLSMSLLVGWSQLLILQPLEAEAKKMKHMDPSEIIAVPLPLEQVTGFAVLPTVILMMYWLVKNPTSLLWNTMNLIKLTGVMYAMFALSGNYLVQNWQHSLATSLYVATLLATTAKEIRTSDLLKELPFYDLEDIISTCRLYSTLLCTIPFQVLTVLDHGMQIQRWPAPVLLGSTYGYAFGTLIGILVNYFDNQRKQSKSQ